MINIIIPMAGLGSRFQTAGYTRPKPFIEFDQKMMIEHVLDGLRYPNAHYTLIIRKSFLTEYADCLAHLSARYHATYITVDRLTQGAACTALASHEIINNALPVVFADSDNIFSNLHFQSFLTDCQNRKTDGSLLTFLSDNPCFSYARIDNDGHVTETREKDPISPHALCGIYYFRHGADFVKNALEMMIYGDRTKNEFYMSNVYNYAIRNGLSVNIYNIPSAAWNCVGTPQQLQKYLEDKEKNS